MTVRPRAPMLLLTAVVAACAPVDRGGGPGDTAPPVSIRDLVAVPNPANVLSYYVWWTTDRASSTALDLDCGEHAVTITGPGLREDHEVVVLGLYPGAACTFIARSEAPDRGTGEASVTVEAGAPPSDTLPPLDVAVPSSDRTQSGWTVFNLSHAGDPQPPVVAVVDPAGRYRWYHVRATGISSSGMVVRRVPEGFLMGGGSDGASSWPALVDLEGRVLWEEELPYEHHEILPWGPDGQDVLFLSRTVSCPAGIPQSATVVAWDRSESRPLWEWSLCEHYAPEEIGDPDWDHTNAIVPVPDTDDLLLSVRNLSRIFRVDLGTGEVLWTLGLLGDFRRVDGGMGAAFYRQHGPELVAADRVLLFDNGKEGVRENSGAVELFFDEVSMEYGVAWSWYPDPPIFCEIWGDADRLENGNTLITFGRREDLESHLVEVTPEGERAWELVTPPSWGWYRADRIDPLPGGYVVED